MNIVTTDSHVGEIERSIRTIKERLRSSVHGLPFKRLPRIMITHMVSDSVRCLNQFPRANGISSTMSPATIVTGSASPDYHAMRLEFGTYVQVFEENAPSNTPRSRSLGAIALSPTGNAQGDYYFLSLASGARISRHQWTVLPTPDTAIARVEALALHEGRPLIQERGFVIEWRPDHPIDDTEYDVDYALPTVVPADDPFDALDYDPIDLHELDDLYAPVDAPLFDGPAVPDQGANDAADSTDNEDDEDDVVPFDDEDDIDPFDDDSEHPAGSLDENPTAEAELFAEDEAEHLANANAPEPAEDGQDEGADHDTGADHADERVPPYYLRPRTVTRGTFKDAIDAPHGGQSYYPPTQLLQKALTKASLINMDDRQRFAFNFVLMHMATTCTQMSERAGLRKHGKAAEAALMTELSQLEDLDAYEVLDLRNSRGTDESSNPGTKHIQREAKRSAQKSHMRRWTVTTQPLRQVRNRLPTVSTDALMLTIIIEALRLETWPPQTWSVRT
ncbi:Reverse transcriptase (RNA-dependent DNA polymerase) [Fragilaria crotonensis]|nr:Reverse transcriptase (RNA-dependent DNA polymerase) [Fragilaria crotonensis]